MSTELSVLDEFFRFLPLEPLGGLVAKENDSVTRARIGLKVVARDVVDVLFTCEALSVASMLASTMVDAEYCVKICDMLLGTDIFS